MIQYFQQLQKTATTLGLEDLFVNCEDDFVCQKLS